MYAITLCIDYTTLDLAQNSVSAGFFSDLASGIPWEGGRMRENSPLRGEKGKISGPKAHLCGYGCAVSETIEATQFLSCCRVILLVIIFN